MSPSRSRFSARKTLPAAVGLAVMLGLAGLAPGQAPAADAAADTQADANAEVDAPPTDREAVEIETSDGVLLSGTYFRATKGGRNTPVVVMLADEGESQAGFERFAMRMQEPKPDELRTPMAVLTVSLRGQGDSTKQRLPGGGTRDLAGQRLTPAAMAAMVHQDLEAVRKFLVERNDSGELNLNRLVYLGVGMGAVVATNGAALDWSMRDLNAGKQGKDVKALLLVSPPWKFKGLGVLDAIRQPGVRSEVAVMLMYGAEKTSAAADAGRIVKQLSRGRPEEGPPTAVSLPTLFDVAANTSLQGTAWLKQGGENAEDLMLRFLEQHVAAPDYKWSQRRLD